MSVKLNTRQVGDLSPIGVSALLSARGRVRYARGAQPDSQQNEEDPAKYIDSAGIGELVAGLTSAAKAGGTMKLPRPTKRVRDLLPISTANTILDVHEDEAHGMRSFA
jgi:hypothetical protein